MQVIKVTNTEVVYSQIHVITKTPPNETNHASVSSNSLNNSFSNPKSIAATLTISLLNSL